MQTAKTKGILLLLLLFTASLLLALGLALPRHTASAQSGVATVNGQTYDSFSAALAAAEEGDTVYVLKDRIDWMPSAQEIDANITIDLGSHASKAASGFSIYVKIAAGKTVTIQNGTFDGKGIKAIAGGEGAAVVIQNVKIDAKDVRAPALQIGSADSLPIEATVKDVEVSVHITATGPAYQNKTAVDVINADALLEGFTLNAGGENAEGKVVVNGISATNSDMVVKNSTITSETGLGFGFFGGMTEEEAKADMANYNTLTLENSSVSGDTFALAGNGTKHGTAVTIQNSTLTGKIGAGIYHPQVGTLTVGGADTKISGTSGIELRAGTLTVSDGEISATAEAFEALPNEAGTDHADGSTVDGAAIAVSQHGYDPDIAVNITGGTFNGVKALYEEDLQNEDVSNISVTVSGGTFEGDVESENVTGFISGGSFTVLPNEDLLGAEYGGVLYNGYYVVVEETTDVGALTVAKLKAQADIRSYSASLGFPWTELSALSGNEKVDAILSAYNAVDAAESEGAVAVARLNALDAIDAYHTYLKGVKETKIGEIETYAAGGQDKAAVAVPTYVISAINGAVSKAEIESYVTAAKAEIDEIRAQRSELSKNFENLNTKADDLATDLTAALEGLAAIEGAVGTNANTLAALQTQLTAVETNIKTEIADIEKLLGTAADEAGNQTLFGRLAALEENLTTVENNIKTAVTVAVTDLSAAVEKIADAVDALPTASVDLSGIEELIGDLQADIDAANAALEGLDGEVSGLASLVGSLDGAQYSMNKALEAFEDAVTEQLTAIQTSLTALAADADDNGAAIAVLQQKADEIAADLQSGNADLTDVAENVVSLQGALEALSADVSAQGGMTGPIIGLYVIVSVLVVLMAAVLVILLKKKN